MKKQFFTTCLIAVISLSILFVSCEKNEDTFNDEKGIEEPELIGSWVRVDTISVHQRSYKYFNTREITYFASNKFFDKIEYIKVDSNLLNPEKKGFQSLSGTYSIQGNKIRYTLLEASFFEEDFPTMTRTEKYANAKDSVSYTINGTVLTLNYLSYPADAPVETNMVFKRK